MTKNLSVKLKQMLSESVEPTWSDEQFREWKDATLQCWRDNQHEEAQKCAELLVNVAWRTNRKQPLTIALWSRANIRYVYSDHRAALEDFYTAGDILHSTGDELDWAWMATGMVGALSQMGNRSAEAEAITSQAEPILSADDTFESGKRRVGMLENLGKVYINSGRYLDAMQMSEEKIYFWQRYSSKKDSASEIARSRINLAVIKGTLNLFNEAIRDLDAADTTLLQSSQFERDVRRSQRHRVWLRMLRNDSANHILRELPSLLEKDAQDKDDFSFLVKVDQWRIENRHTFPNFLAHLQHLRFQCQEHEHHREAVQFTLLIAWHLHLSDQTEAAAAAYQQVQQEAWATQNIDLAAMAGYRLGLLMAQQHEPAASDVWQTTIDQIEEVAQQVAASDVRHGFLHNWQMLYRMMARHALAQHDTEALWYWSERMRGRELVDLLSAESSASAPSSERHIFETKRKQLAQLPANSSEHKQLTSELLALQRRLDRSQDIQWLRDKTASAAQIAATLPNDTLLLSFITLPQHIADYSEQQQWVIPITGTGIQQPRALKRPIAVTEIEAQVRLMESIIQRDPSQPLEARQQQQLLTVQQAVLADWYDRLLHPIQSYLDQYERVVIISEGEMIRLPFAAFYNHERERYFGETNIVSYIPSATAWQLAREHESQAHMEATSLIFAYDQPDGLRAIPHTIKSAETIEQLLPFAISYTGDDAISAQLTTQTAEQARYLHFAAHADFQSDQPAFSYIQLADRKLRAIDVAHLQLSAELVVLSACDTVRGLWLGGTWLGLPRAFLVAGAKSVLVTYWKVEDQATATFMKLFYEAISTGDTPTVALSHAQRQMLSSHYDFPYFWGGFSLFGSAS